MKSIVKIVNGKVAQEWAVGLNGVSIGHHSVTTQIPDALVRDGLRWKIPADVDRATVKASEWTDTGTEWRETVTEFYTQAELDQQAADAEAAWAAEVKAQNFLRWVLDDVFLLVCELYFGDRTKRSTGELIGKLPALAPADALRAMAIMVGINTEQTRVAGAGWWDSCEWHDDVDVVEAARAQLAAMKG